MGVEDGEDDGEGRAKYICIGLLIEGKKYLQQTLSFEME